MFLQQRGIAYQTSRCHRTNTAPCSTHDHTHHCYQQLICIVSLFSTSFRRSCCHCSRCAPVSNQPCAPFPTHYSQHLYNYCCMSKWPTAGGYRGCRAERHVPSGLAASWTRVCHRNSESHGRHVHVEMHMTVVRFLHHVAISGEHSGFMFRVGEVMWRT